MSNGHTSPAERSHEPLGVLTQRYPGVCPTCHQQRNQLHTYLPTPREAAGIENQQIRAEHKATPYYYPDTQNSEDQPATPGLHAVTVAAIRDSSYSTKELVDAIARVKARRP